MPTLADAIRDDAKKPAIIEDCLLMIDAEVADKGGLSGIAIKAGYGVVKGIKPGFIRQVVTDLLPEFARALEPLSAEAQSKGRGIGEHLRDNAGRTADALLSITDAKAQRAKSGAVKGAYERLRGSAKKNVEAAVPRLSRVIEKHTS
jgi:hypothetical protein